MRCDAPTLARRGAFCGPCGARWGAPRARDSRGSVLALCRAAEGVLARRGALGAALALEALRVALTPPRRGDLVRLTRDTSGLVRLYDVPPLDDAPAVVVARVRGGSVGVVLAVVRGSLWDGSGVLVAAAGGLGWTVSDVTEVLVGS